MPVREVTKGIPVIGEGRGDDIDGAYSYPPATPPLDNPYLEYVRLVERADVLEGVKARDFQRYGYCRRYWHLDGLEEAYRITALAIVGKLLGGDTPQYIIRENTDWIGFFCPPGSYSLASTDPGQELYWKTVNARYRAGNPFDHRRLIYRSDKPGTLRAIISAPYNEPPEDIDGYVRGLHLKQWERRWKTRPR